MGDPVITKVGISKCYCPVQVRQNIIAADFPSEPRDLSKLAGSAIEIGLSPLIQFWGDCDSTGSQITFAFVFFDDKRNVIGATLPHSLDSAGYKNGDRFVGEVPDTIDVGSAWFAAPIVLGLTLGSWNLYWRYFGLFRYPC